MMLLASGSAAHADSVSIAASGTIASSCSIAKASDFAAADFSVNGSRTASATVNCNTGFAMTATSANGAVTTAAATSVNFTSSLAYNFSLSVPLESGGSAVATCTSAAMLANSCSLSSGGVAAIARTATLTTSWTVPALPLRLVAGAYSDVITVSIATVP
jgi:hypothetical protein